MVGSSSAGGNGDSNAQNSTRFGDCSAYRIAFGVDAGRIGLLGFSLGAYLALSVASVEPRVKAVVEFFGGIPEELHGFKRMAPVLILHGEQDRIVPVSEAIRLQQLLQRTGSPYEIKIYPDAGHGFNGLQFLDAGQRTLKFLRKYL